MDDARSLPVDIRKTVLDPKRLTTLRSFLPRSEINDPDFDAITGLAKQLFQVPISLLSVVDDEEQWFQSCVGMTEKSTPISSSFCAHAISQESSSFVILDAKSDERFRNNPLVTGPPHIRFYAGAPIIIEGQKVGTLCVIDDKPHADSDETQLAQLVQLASLAASLITTKHFTGRHASVSEQLEEQRTRHSLAATAANIATWVWHLETDKVVHDHMLLTLFGLEEKTEITAAELIGAILEDDRPGVQQSLAESIESGQQYEAEFRVADGQRWLMGRGRVLARDEDGKAKTIVGINMDITENKLSQENTRLLLREVNHRVKNTLAILQSMAVQTLRRSSSTEDFTRAFSGRLQSIGAAHTLLSDSEWKPIDVHKLIVSQLAPIRSEMHRVEINGEPFSFNPDIALGLGLIIHELATNAYKYGSMSNDEGRILIDFVVEQNDEGQQVFKLYWQECDGPPVKVSSDHGFGKILINRSLDKVIGSEVDIDYDKAGVRAFISIPV